MSRDSCIHPDCKCLDYCEAEDPHSATPRRTSIIDEAVEEVSEPYALRDDDPYESLPRERRNDPPWPFDDMQVGECFDEFNPLLWDRVRACASMYGYKHRKKFATRVLHHDDWDNNSTLYSVRVWRLE